MIDNISSTATAASVTPAPSKPSDVAKIHSTAQQFEALLIGELLKTSREAARRDGSAPATMTTPDRSGWKWRAGICPYAGSSGGLGLSKTIEAGMRQDAAGAHVKQSGLRLSADPRLGSRSLPRGFAL